MQPDHSAAREVVFEALCPDQSPQAAQTFLHHATSSLRRILEPDLPEKFPSRYLRVENERVTLCYHTGPSRLRVVRAVASVPAEDKMEDSASNRGELLEAALPLYGGELFLADRYAD